MLKATDGVGSACSVEDSAEDSAQDSAEDSILEDGSAGVGRWREFCHFTDTPLFIPVGTPDRGTGGVPPNDRTLADGQVAVAFFGDGASNHQVRGRPTTWTILQNDGPDHLGLCCNADPWASCGPMSSVSPSKLRNILHRFRGESLGRL